MPWKENAVFYDWHNDWISTLLAAPKVQISSWERTRHAIRVGQHFSSQKILKGCQSWILYLLFLCWNCLAGDSPGNSMYILVAKVVWVVSTPHFYLGFKKILCTPMKQETLGFNQINISKYLVAEFDYGNSKISDLEIGETNFSCLFF